MCFSSCLNTEHTSKNKPRISQKYSNLPHTETFMSPSSFPLTHKTRSLRWYHFTRRLKTGLVWQSHLSITLHTSWHSHFLHARPRDKGERERAGEGENHSSLRKHQTIWKHCPEAQSLKGLVPTDCLFLFPASCESRLYYHLHHLLWQGWFNRSTPALGMSSCLIFFRPVNCAVISRLAWPFESQSTRIRAGRARVPAVHVQLTDHRAGSLIRLWW